MTDISVNVAVLGAGPGGYAAAFLAADLGLRVALIDEEANPGGVCSYRGCIPSKALLHIAKLVDEARHASAWGIEFGAPKIDLDQLRGFKNSVVQRLTGGTGQLVRHRKITYVQGRATISDANSFSVTTREGQTRVSFEHGILATGSRPAVVPGLPTGSARVLDSTSALELDVVPGRLLVIGGGYIGLELGTVYAALGSRVSVVEMLPGLLPGADRDMVAILAKRIETLCERVLLSTKVVDVKEDAEGLLVTFESADGSRSSERFDRVLVAVGRKPNSQIPGLDRTRVRVDAKGFIEVDAQRRTHEPSLFAIGDVAGEPMLAHKASAEGRVAAETIAGKKVVFDPVAIPAVVFTDPELAWCGLTEQQALDQKIEVKIAKFPWGASGRSLTLDRTDGLTKLLIDPKTERILGVGLVGPGAGELIAEGVLAVEMAAVATDLGLSIHPHPTLSETVMEAAHVFHGDATHVFRPKR
ncbi:MAG: dihydrolipoyl dehydrogenase [Vicinamibacterales bacterium]